MARFSDTRYQRLFDRIEQEIDLEDLTTEEIKKIISPDAFRGVSLDTRKIILSPADLRNQIEDADDIPGLQKLLIKSLKSLLFKQELIDFVKSKLSFWSSSQSIYVSFVNNKIVNSINIMILFFY